MTTTTERQGAAAVTDKGPPAGGHPALNGTANPSEAVCDGRLEGRDAGGRFAKGNKHSLGNPFSRKLAERRALFLDAFTAEDLRLVVRKMVDLVLTDADVSAARLLLEYGSGRPAAAVDPDHLDLREWELLDSSPTKGEVLRALLDGLPPGVAVKAINDLLPKLVAEAEATHLFGGDRLAAMQDFEGARAARRGS